MRIARGTFTPGQGHVLRGSFSIRFDGQVHLMETSEDFFFDGSPDPGFALHTGIPVSADNPELQRRMVETRFFDLPGDVVEVRGRRVGTIPPTLDPSAFDTLVLWCFRFPFILGYGAIERLQPPDIQGRDD